MKAFYLRNHSSSDLHSIGLDDLALMPARPPFPDKETFAQWCHSPTTRHVFYTLYEPACPTIRSSAQNPVRLMHGVVADYDGAASTIEAALGALSFPTGRAPAWITRTFSRKARLVWAFERPVPVFTEDVARRLRANLARELKLKDLLPGFDVGAWDNPHTPFELGTDWKRPHGPTHLPHELVLTALHDASARAKFVNEGPLIPMEAVAAEVEQRFPGRWKGAFLEGARGVRFWDEKADNPTGCTLRATGVQAWTGESRFLTWAEVLGAEFLRRHRVNRIGGAISGTYYDGRDYWQRDEGGTWRGFSGQQLGRRLAVMQSLSTESRKGTPSEVAQAVTAIENLHAVDGAFPCLFVPSEVVRDGNQQYLNISRVRVVEATPGPTAWGEGFPWIAKYLDGIFDETQLAVFLSWVAHFYNSARSGRPRKGHALFIAGSVSAGKTFLSQRIVGGLLGGSEEATSYMLGNTAFNEQLFLQPVWTVDDAVANADPRRHAQYSQMVKKFVANPRQEFHPKFKKAVSFRFNGRLIVTMNNDATSLKMLPEIEHSILDKLVILRAGKTTTSFVGAEETAAQELSAFGSFISGWKIPDWLLTRADETTRFGHDSWHHPDLIDTANDSSPAAGLVELLEIWRPIYFRATRATEWIGTATLLMAELSNTDTVATLLNRVVSNRNALGSHLQALERRGISWIRYSRANGVRNYRISRPEDLPAAP